ncbi:MAG: dUTP diphosphatase [Clostridium chrysemydis]|uniref:dUTP diphosphatase n=1 Tax=Clostridium chrysemydis TaxID=2665504 RepID=UPI003F3256C4
MKIRGFELVKDEKRVHAGVEIILPKRGTKGSAGYDICSPISFELKPNEEIMIFSDVKAYMQLDEVLKLYVRSSMGMKGLFLKNTVGIIDSTYYSNESNDGNIGMKLVNKGNNVIKIEAGERIAQGVFLKFLTVDGDSDENLEERIGGYGSTGK